MGSILSEAFQIFAAFSSRVNISFKLSDNTLISSFYALVWEDDARDLQEKYGVIFLIFLEEELIFSTQKDNQQQREHCPRRVKMREFYQSFFLEKILCDVFRKEDISSYQRISLWEKYFCCWNQQYIGWEEFLCVLEIHERENDVSFISQIFPCTFSCDSKKSFVSLQEKLPFLWFRCHLSTSLYAFEEFFCHIV